MLDIDENMIVRETLREEKQEKINDDYDLKSRRKIRVGSCCFRWMRATLISQVRFSNLSRTQSERIAQLLRIMILHQKCLR